MKKIASAIAGFGFICAPFFAAADIVQLPATTGQNSSPLSCFDLTRTLTVGSKLYDVRGLQFDLKQEGFSVPTSEYGIFGSATLDAVKAYQQKYASEILRESQTPTGVVGLRTRTKLNASYGCAKATTKTSYDSSVKLSLAIKNASIDSNGVTITACNQGVGDVPLFPIRLRLNGIIRDFSLTNALKAGSCETQTLPFGTWGLNYDAGVTFALVTAIDPNGFYKTSQNVFPLIGTTTLAVPAIPGVHLSVRGIQIKSNGIQATLCNLGDTDLSSFPVRATVNTVSRDLDANGAYMHGKCTSQLWTYDMWNIIPSAGLNINATVVVDPNNIYKETDEFDNTATIVGSI